MAEAKVRTEDERTLVLGMLQMTDALEHAMRALMLCRPPEDPKEQIQHFKHLMSMTAGVNAAKDTCGSLLDEEGKKLADEIIDREREQGG